MIAYVLKVLEELIPLHLYLLLFLFSFSASIEKYPAIKRLLAKNKKGCQWPVEKKNTKRKEQIWERDKRIRKEQLAVFFLSPAHRIRLQPG